MTTWPFPALAGQTALPMTPGSSSQGLQKSAADALRTAGVLLLEPSC